MSAIAAAAQTADRIDYWIRRHVIQYCYETHPSENRSRCNPARDRRVGLSAIGQCLKDQYNALATPMPVHLKVRNRRASALALLLGLRVCPKTSGGITKFSEHEAD
jgi:hypothetical protein